jgi:hypothetical protein
MVVPIVGMAIFMGVVPNLFLRPMEPSVHRIVERVTGAQPRQVEASPGAIPRTRGTEPGVRARASE